MEETLESLESKNLKLKFNLRLARLKAERLAGKHKDLMAAFEKREEAGLAGIPMFIISFDRLDCLKKTISALERVGITNIHIIDNNSSYPPLLDYYKNTPYDVIYMGENLGSRVFWKSDRFDNYRNDFYMVSDSDIELTPECPGDVVKKMFDTLKAFPFVRKVGVSLKIDDIPDDAVNAEQVKRWESQFFKAPINGYGAYYASVDTTLGLWLPDNFAEGIPFLRAIRTAEPYMARHLPWYKRAGDITDEDRYYSDHRSNGWWDMAKGEITPD